MSSMDKVNKETSVEGSPLALARDMKQLINNKEFSDVKFLVGPEKVIFRGHKCILAARCHVFKAMFKESLSNEEPYVLADMTPDLFTSILQFIYTNTCKINSQNVMNVLSASMEYGMDQLVKICEKYIGESVTIETACDAMQAAVTFGLDNFKRMLLPFFEQHTAEIFQTKGFNELSDTTLAYIMQSDELNMDEYELLKAIKSWAVVNSVALGRPLCEVARTVVCNLRLPLLSPEELGQLETENVKEHFISVEQISMAWKHHALKTPMNSTLDTTPRKGTRSRQRDR